MRQLRYVDFDCPTCGAACTRFVYFDTDLCTPIDDEVCGQFRGFVSASGWNIKSGESVTMPTKEITCEGVLVAREMSGIGYMKTISRGDSDFNERERARLEKRADDHWKRQGKDEAIDRERAFLKKQGAVGGVK